MLDVGRLALTFARVNRITKHEDGERFESDTDHTVMLSLVACAFAARYLPQLDCGRIAQYALIHDLVEAYAGDTPTFGGISEEERREKEYREKEALNRLHHEFDDEFPWITEMIEAYESMQEPEARYVKSVDKIMPKITHALNGGVVIKQMGHTFEDVARLSQTQMETLKASYAHDFETFLDLWVRLNERLLEEPSC